MQRLIPAIVISFLAVFALLLAPGCTTTKSVLNKATFGLVGTEEGEKTDEASAKEEAKAQAKAEKTQRKEQEKAEKQARKEAKENEKRAEAEAAQDILYRGENVGKVVLKVN